MLNLPGEVAEGVALAGVSDFASVQTLETNLSYEQNLFPATPTTKNHVKFAKLTLQNPSFYKHIHTCSLVLNSHIQRKKMIDSKFLPKKVQKIKRTKRKRF